MCQENIFMKFKITLIIGIFFLIINSLSIATPVSQSQTSPQKSEQKIKKERNPIKRLLINRLAENPEKAHTYAIWALILGSLSVLTLLILLAPVQATISLYILLVSMVLGNSAILLGGVLQSSDDRKTRRLGRIAWVLGLIGVAVVAVLYFRILYGIFRFLTTG